MNGATSTPDLLGLVNRQITPDLIHRAALQLGEDDDHLQSAMAATVPSVLTALSDVASSDTGAAHLARMIRGMDVTRPRVDSVASSLGSTVGRAQGATLFDGETGVRASKIADAVAHVSGIKSDSAHKLLGGATGATLLTIGRSWQRIEPERLRALLGEHRKDYVQRLPAPVASLFEDGSAAGAPADSAVSEVPASTPGTPAIRRVTVHARRNWLAPLIIFVALILVAVPLFRALRRPMVPTVLNVPTAIAPPPTVSLRLPDGQSLTVQRGSSIYDLATFLAGTGATPARFTLAPLNFQSATTQLTPQSMRTVDELAAILRTYPTATIKVESYGGAGGSGAANLDLARDRSDTVKGLLGSRGVDPSRIDATGLGQEPPAASNAPANGRAQNPRTDVVVTGR